MFQSPVSRKFPRCDVGSAQPCSDPGELARLKLGFSATFPWLGEERNQMKASKFSDTQKVFIIKQGEDGTAVAEICRKARISWL